MEAGEPIISVRNLGIRFRERVQHRQLRSWFVLALQKLLGRTNSEPIRSKWFWALRNVTFDIYEGSSVGLVGLNGAGKSTLIQCLAGIFTPSEGEVVVRGQVTAVLGLNVGFVGEVSGRENIFLVGLLLGFSEQQMQELAPQIIEFSGLGSAIDRPVKYYSSGMKSRLGFAIVSSLEPDILLLDEVLAVGDRSFQKRCQERLDQMLERASTIVLCSHSMDAIRRQCELTLWLHHGRMKMFGPTDEVVAAYEEFLQEVDDSELAVINRKSRKSLLSRPKTAPKQRKQKQKPKQPQRDKELDAA